MNNRLTRYEFDYRDPKETIWQEKVKQRHVWSESLRRSHDADREAARGVLPQAGHTSRCSYDEGRNSRSRQHRLWLQLHHRGNRVTTLWPKVGCNGRNAIWIRSFFCLWFNFYFCCKFIQRNYARMGTRIKRCNR